MNSNSIESDQIRKWERDIDLIKEKGERVNSPMGLKGRMFERAWFNPLT